MTLSCPRVDVNQMEWTGKTSSDCSIGTNMKLATTKEQQEADERDIVNILVTTNQMEKIVIDERYPQ